MGRPLESTRLDMYDLIPRSVPSDFDTLLVGMSDLGWHNCMRNAGVAVCDHNTVLDPGSPGLTPLRLGNSSPKLDNPVYDVKL